MVNYVYFVPTNRLLGENVRSFCEEARHAMDTYQIALSFVVTDDCTEKDNRNYVQKLAEEYVELPFYYFDRQRTTELLKQVFQEFSPDIRKRLNCLLPKREINYGNTLNREFILAILLNSRYMMRRDSDVHIVNENGQNLYPIDMEVSYLGKEHKGRTNYIIGSGYRGKWGIDIDDIVVNNDFTLFKALMQCMNIPADFLDTIIEDEFIKTSRYDGDNVNYQSAAYPQCGNIGYYNLFRAIPCSPAADIIATDYFLLETAYETGLNVGYHTRTVLHKHTKERTEYKRNIMEYWERVAMWVGMELVYKSFVKKMQPVDYELESTEQCKKYNRYIQSYFKGTNIKNAELSSIRKERYADFIDVILKFKKPVYREVAENLRREENRIHEAVTQSFDMHLDLLEIWPDFVDGLDALKDRSHIRKILEGAIL